MAEYSIDESAKKITLSFKFSFHKKQVELDKNRRIIANAIAAVYGDGYTTNILVIEATDVPKTPAVHEERQEKQVASSGKSVDLQNISDIFGGVDLLDS